MRLTDKYRTHPLTGDTLPPLLNAAGAVIPTGQRLALTAEDWDTIDFSVETRTAGVPVIHRPTDPTPTVVPLFRDIVVEEKVIEAGAIVFDTLPLRSNRLAVSHPAPVPAPAFHRSEPNPANIRSVGIEHGLKSLVLWDCIEDSQGSIWTVGEGGGLSRYDGEYTQTYTKRDGLTTDVLLDIFQDSRQNIWLGGWGGNPMRYDGQHFYEYPLLDKDDPVLVNQIREDAAGNIWFSASDDGVFVLQDSLLLRLTDLPLVGKPAGSCPAPDGRVWIGGDKGIVEFTDMGSPAKALLFPEKMHAFGVAPSLLGTDGTLWMTAWGYGLIREQAGRFQELTPADGLLSGRVMDLAQDHSGALWIGTQGGLHKWSDGQFENFTDASGLPVNDVYGLCVDGQNNLWLALSGGGLALLRQNGLTNLTPDNGLPHDQLAVLAELDDGSKAMGFWGNGLLVTKGSEQHLYREEHGLRTNYVISMYASGNRVYFQDFYGMGVFDGAQFRYYNDPVEDYVVFNFHEQDEENLWLGTKQYGMLKKEGSTFRQLKLPAVDIRGYYPIHEDEDGSLWVGVDRILAHVEEEHVTYYSAAEGFFSSQMVQRITRDERGNLWIATKGGGLHKFDGESFRQVISPDPAQNGDVEIAVDDADRIWMMAPLQLSVVRPGEEEDYVISHFTKQNGLQNFELSTLLYSDDGRMYVGGRDGGLDIFDLDEFVLPESTPRININSLDINGEYQDFSEPEAERSPGIKYTETAPFSQLPQSLAVASRNNHLTIRFAGTDWSGREDIRYRYRLSPLEEDWSTPTEAASIDYRNLPYGDLTFRVQARGKNQRWSEPAVYHFSVNPPWWQTTPAYLGYLLLLILLIFSVTQLRTRALRQRQKVMALEIENATREISRQKEKAERSEKYKEQFLANMSHEIRTPLNGIQGMLKMMKRKQHPAHQDVLLDAMTQSSANLAVLLNDILDLSKIEAGKIEIAHTPLSLAQVVDHVVFTLGFKAKQKNLELDVAIDEGLPAFVMGDAQRLSQILINLVGNAVKFSDNGTIHLRVTRREDYLQFSVADEGIGIAPAELETVFGSFTQATHQGLAPREGTGLGLSITKQLVELQGGRIWVESEEGVGTTFTFELPLMEAAAATPTEMPREARLREMGGQLRGLKILVADDDAFNGMIARDEAEWFIPETEVTVVRDGRAALTHWRDQPYDLVITDVQMPEFSGYDLARRIRAEENKTPGRKRTPILAMTASVLSRDIAKCRAAGMDGYIPKPFQSHEFMGEVFASVTAEP